MKTIICFLTLLLLSGCATKLPGIVPALDGKPKVKINNEMPTPNQKDEVMIKFSDDQERKK